MKIYLQPMYSTEEYKTLLCVAVLYRDSVQAILTGVYRLSETPNVLIIQFAKLLNEPSTYTRSRRI